MQDNYEALQQAIFIFMRRIIWRSIKFKTSGIRLKNNSLSVLNKFNMPNLLKQTITYS